MTTTFMTREATAPREGQTLGRGVAYWPLALTLPGLVAAGALAYSIGPRRLSRPVRVRLSWALAGASALGVARWQLARLFTAIPSYQLERRFGELELRHYPRHIQAETTVAEEDWDQALAAGLRRLDGYMRGGNTGGEQLSMTWPILSSPAERDELEMSSPVTARTPEGYTLAILMPSERNLPSLPEPRDPRVTLRALPPRRVGVLRRSGRFTCERLRAEESRLLVLVERAGLVPISEPALARYDAPWTLPMLRRFELWVDVADARSDQTSPRTPGGSST
jgi:hypothetical protein